MKDLRQVKIHLFINNFIMVFICLCLLTACVLTFMASPASASPQEYGEFSAEDFKESKISPAGDAPSFKTLIPKPCSFFVDEYSISLFSIRKPCFVLFSALTSQY